MEKMSKQMMDYIEESKDKVSNHKKENKKVQKFLKKDDVKEVFE